MEPPGWSKWNGHQNGIFGGETDVVERIGGQAPQALDAFIREHRTAFGATETVAPYTTVEPARNDGSSFSE